jgi:predicted dienelactone hydrolase
MPRQAFARGAALLLGLVLALGAALPAHAGRPRYADPNALGRYAVGHTLFQAVDPARDGRTLRTELWYPVDPADAGGVHTRYDFQYLGLGLDSTVAWEDAPPSHDVAFPLVVFSHGSGGVSWQSTFLTEALASHGFVVVAPNHTGNTANDALAGTSDPFPVVARNRPLDVSFLIDLLLARDFDPGDVLYLKINPFLIGVAGHSFGGFTALAMASGYQDAAAGTDVPPDPRVRAVAAVAPASSLLSDAELESIHVPVFLLSGTLDTTTPIDPETTRPWTLVPGRPLYRADVVGATHTHFAAVCAIAQVLATFGVPEPEIVMLVPGYEETCKPPAFPIEEAQRIQSFYLTAFFARHLYGDRRYDGFLTPEWAADHEPDVLFQRRDAAPATVLVLRPGPGARPGRVVLP